MLITNHVLAGALVGAALRRPVPALVVGVASHLAMDSLPHWGDDDGDQVLVVARRDGITGLAAIAGLLAAAPARHRVAIGAGILGAVAPDLRVPAQHFLGVQPYPEPFDRLHTEVQQEAPHRMPRELVTTALLGAVAAGALAVLHRRAG